MPPRRHGRRRKHKGPKAYNHLVHPSDSEGPSLCAASLAALELPEALAREVDRAQATRELTAVYSHWFGERCERGVEAPLLAATTLAVELSEGWSKGEDLDALERLVQAASARLPKQKRLQLAALYKQVAVARQRRIRGQERAATEHKHEYEVPWELMPLVLGHLDPVSVLRAGAVCRAWRTCAMDDSLWRVLHRAAFGRPVPAYDPSRVRPRRVQGAQVGGPKDRTWRDEFRTRFTALGARGREEMRGAFRCGSRRVSRGCGAVFWPAAGGGRSFHHHPGHRSDRVCHVHGASAALAVREAVGWGDEDTDSSDSSDSEYGTGGLRLWAIHA
mmetsp:Transcript_70560/g.223562  ORF Transcript_70560/g.223562 Transcript_70560/m.223562 type:complete len:332 (+) Transcript_70560:57-1052(+)